MMSKLEELTEDFGVTLKHMAEQSYKPMTNGDRIRAMTDEELVVFLDKFSGRCMDCFSADCPIYKEGLYCRPRDIMDWLKQPVEVET